MVKKVKLDFSKVEERTGWNTRQMPEGLHEFKVASVEDKEAQDGTDMWVFALVPTAGKYATRRFPYYCKLQENQLWKVRDLLVAAGVPVPKKAVLIDPTKAVGKLVAGEVVDASGQYEGRSEINGIYGLDAIDGSSPEDDEDETEEDEEWSDEADDEEEYGEEEDEEEFDYETMTLAELRKLAKSLGVDTTGLKKAELIEYIQEESEEDEDDEDEDLDEDDLDDEDLEDEEFDDEEEEEEEPTKPARRSAPARKPAPKAAPAKRVVRRR